MTKFKLDNKYVTIANFLAELNIKILKIPKALYEIFIEKIYSPSIGNIKYDFIKPQLIGSFQPFADMANDTVDTFAKYNSESEFGKDCLQPIFGLGNLFKSAFYLLFVLLLVIPTLIFLPIVIITCPYFKNKREDLKQIFGLGGTLLLSWFIDGIVSAIRGSTQIVFTPFLILKTPFRGLLTLIDYYTKRIFFAEVAEQQKEYDFESFEKIKIGLEGLVYGDFERIETKEDNETRDIMIEETVNDALEISPSDDLAVFQTQADCLWNVLNTSPHDLSQLLTQCKQFGQSYYKLAKKYHPDKGDESEKNVRTAYIQELNKIYKPVKERADQKLERLKPSESKKGLIEEHRKWQDEFRKKIDVLILELNELDEDVKHLDKNMENLELKMDLVKRQQEFMSHVVKEKFGKEMSNFTKVTRITTPSRLQSV